MAKQRQRKKRRTNLEDQYCVIVRIDWVIYALAGLLIILALLSVLVPDRVDLALITATGTLMAGIITGWLTYMRLSRRPNDDDDDDGAEDGAAPGTE